jgi:hypothetical protein
MSLSALNPSIAGAPPPAEHPRDLGGKSAGGSNFAAIVDALASEDLRPGAGPAAAPGAASPQDQISPSQHAQPSRQSPWIEAGLAGLFTGALAPPAAATPGQFVSRDAGFASAAQPDASGSTSAAAPASPPPGGALRRALAERGAGASSDQPTEDSAAAAPAPTAENGADASLTLAGLLYGALASPAAATPGQIVPRGAGGASSRALAEGGSVASSDQTSGGLAAAALAPAAKKGAGANFALAGALDAPLTIRTAANGDTSLGVRAVQSRTHLAVDSAARSSAWNSIPSAPARSAAAATTPALSDAAGTLAAAKTAAAATSSVTPSQTPSASGVAPAATAPARPDTAGTLAAAKAAAAPTPSETSSTLGVTVTATAPARSAAAGTLAAAKAAAAPTPSVTPSQTPSTSGVAPAATAPARPDTAGTLAATKAAAAPTPGATRSGKPSTSGAAATATASARSETAETLAAAAAPTPNDTPSEKRSTANHNGSPSRSLPDPSAGPGQAAVGPNASLGVNLGGNPVTTGGGPIACSQLPERLAAEASGLTSKPPPSDTAATGVGAAQPVKELRIDLDPVDLGAVSVQMRLAGGKLSVVMEVATASTLTAIENERRAIADRLGSTAQPLETLIIKPAATSQTSAEGDNARNHNPAGQENAQNDANPDSQGNGRQPARRDSATDQRNPRASAPQPGSSRGFGGLVV